jgi:hypothetical protein
MDTKILIPDLDDAHQQRSDDLKAQAKTAVADKVNKVREQWKCNRRQKYAGPDADEDLIREINASLERALEHSILDARFKITVVTDNGDEVVTVEEVLASPHLYDGMLTKDPLEPDYQNGKTVGKLYLRGSKPVLYSFAHGGRTYKLRKAIPRIEVVDGQTYACVNQTLEIMSQDPSLYDLGETLVKVEDGSVYPLDEAHLIHELGGMAQFWRWKKKTNGDTYELLLDPPPRVAKPIIAKGKLRKLKSLTAVITAPTLVPGGSVIDKPGYDASSGLLFDTQSPPQPVPLSPSLVQVQDALNTLLHPFKDFPFVDDIDRGVCLAALLTSVSRPALKTAPAFGIDAPVQASGKTLLAQAIGALGTGKNPAVWPHTSSRDDEEVRKRIMTALRSNTLCIVWDNVVGQFDSAALASALTASEYTDRILGKSEGATVPNRALFILTGNNLTISGDMARRVLPIRIDPVTDEPFAREFDLNPLEYVLKHRQEMVRAALTVIRGYLTSGASRAKGRMASFEEWDDYVRQTVAWVEREFPNLGVEDPMNAVMTAQVSDPEQETLSALLAAWQAVFGAQSVSAKDALTELNNCLDQSLLPPKAAVRGALEELNSGRSVTSAQLLGRVLGYRKGRIVNGRRMEAKVDTATNQKLWSVVDVP